MNMLLDPRINLLYSYNYIPIPELMVISSYKLLYILIQSGPHFILEKPELQNKSNLVHIPPNQLSILVIP
ncbi:hypothetical protein NARC_240015 [Candidatus Nitrosocosmicus arcticus]|uniref:Uncharacterized protein n=1 Tax=Candidatus Nitrosocosmicus arcticus TaxID=2035267 RepID=A0A557SQX7_9ARCH|nr:hypothetical protein NARC_240015 [Candidatus Nitrosocosmicus arcticus]